MAAFRFWICSLPSHHGCFLCYGLFFLCTQVAAFPIPDVGAGFDDDDFDSEDDDEEVC